MKPVRRSRRSKQLRYDEAAGPVQRRSYGLADGSVIFVTHKTGYPGPGERINDETAVFALRHRRPDIVAWYLRETRCIPLQFRCVLADMLEAGVNTREEYRFKYVRRSSGSPKGSTPAARARAQSRQEHIGRCALDWGRHGSKRAQEEFSVSASYVEKAMRLVKDSKNQ
jgi:hypothetical protein